MSYTQLNFRQIVCPLGYKMNEVLVHYYGIDKTTQDAKLKYKRICVGCSHQNDGTKVAVCRSIGESEIE